jgi:hypothetical protein
LPSTRNDDVPNKEILTAASQSIQSPSTPSEAQPSFWEKAEVKRRKIENGEEVKLPIYATQFSKEEIDSEERRPKKKLGDLIS